MINRSSTRQQVMKPKNKKPKLDGKKKFQQLALKAKKGKTRKT
jgi:hypothetical protein